MDEHHNLENGRVSLEICHILCLYYPIEAMFVVFTMWNQWKMKVRKRLV